MSTDKDITDDLVEVLKDGAEGFAHAADKLRDSTRADLAPTFDGFARQRSQFATELEQLAAAYGDDVDEDGSITAAAHRLWMSAKDTLTGSDPDGVLDVAEQGEDHAVARYEEALAADISPQLRDVVRRQFVDIKAAHDDVKALRDRVA